MSKRELTRKLIQEIKKYPFIYDKAHQDNKNRKLKEGTWNVISAKISVPPIVAKKQWRNLRDQYAREKRMILTEGVQYYKQQGVWHHLHAMSFLWDLIKHRNLHRRCANHSSDTTDDQRVIIELDPSFCYLNEQTLNDDSDLQPQSKLRKLLSEHPEESRVNTPNSDRSDYGSLQEKNNSVPCSPSLYKDDLLFSLSVAASLKRFTAETKADTKIKIQQILYDAEFHKVDSSNNHP